LGDDFITLSFMFGNAKPEEVRTRISKKRILWWTWMWRSEMLKIGQQTHFGDLNWIHAFYIAGLIANLMNDNTT